MAATPLVLPDVAAAGPGPDSATVREAAKWLMGAFAAVFAVLLTGLQFSSLSAVTGAELWFAIGSSAVAFGLTVAVIVRAGRLLADPGLSLDDLLDREVKARTRLLNKRTKADAALRTMSTEDPLLAYVIGHRALLHHSDPSPSNLRDALQTARRAATDAQVTPELAVAAADVVHAVDVANEYHFSRRFRSLTTLAGWASSVGAACVVAFVLTTAGAHDPAPRVQSASEGTLYFGRGVSPASLGMGSDCKVESQPVVIVGGVLSQPIVVSRPTSSCTAVQLLVTAQVGVVVPAAAKDEADK